MEEDSNIWNVVVPVVANLRGAGGEEARARLAAALREAGFEPLDVVEARRISLSPFLAEDGTEEDSFESPASTPNWR